MEFPSDLNKFDEELLRSIEADPENFESFNIEYKIMFDNDLNELRRDIIAFANGKEVGYIFFGIEDEPIKIIGIEKKAIDGLKIVINDAIPKKIDPILTPFPQMKAIPISDGKYVFVIKIFPKNIGIYGIRKNDNHSNRDYLTYEFWTRMDGSKSRLKIEDVVNLILEKGGSAKKLLDIDLNTMTLSPVFPDEPLISISAINKSMRPIKIQEYGLFYEDMIHKLAFPPNEMIGVPTAILNSSLPCVLNDGEDCNAFALRRKFEEISKNLGYEFPMKIKAYFRTNDGTFYSDLVEIDELQF